VKQKHFPPPTINLGGRVCKEKVKKKGGPEWVPSFALARGKKGVEKKKKKKKSMTV